MNGLSLGQSPLYPAIANVGGGGKFNAIAAVGGSLGDLMSALQVQNVKTLLSAAQIKALHTSPITLVSAPGAGLFIYPLIWTFNLVYATTAYSTDGSCDLYWGPQANLENMTDFQLDGMLTTTGNQLQFGLGKQTHGNAPTDFLNQSVLLAAGANPTLGDSPVNVSLTYVTLSST